MKLFRSFRMNAMSRKRMSKYLLYAIGEIILVVIGILIAISINNWNESKKSRRQLQSILRIYEQDLKMDTTVVSANIQQLEEKQKLFNLLLSDTVTAQDYKDNPTSFGLAMTHAPFELQNRGYQMLQNYSDDRSTTTDSLVVKIMALDLGFKKLIGSTQERISEDISDNILYMKNNESWIADLFKGNMDNPDIMTYYLSDDYRTRLALHSVLVNGNLLVILEEYQKSMKGILEELSKRLEV